MRALLSTVVGGPRALQVGDLPPPIIGPRQVLVDVKACGVNFPDVLIIEDKYQVKPQRPFAPGVEISGVINSVHRDVTSVKPGDRVIGIPTWGGMAEQVAVDAARLLQIPDEMPFDDAAVLLATYGTGYYALKQRGRLQREDRVLVLGAAGGAGLAAVQLAKAMGSHVVAAASSEEKANLCRRCGADQAIVYPRALLGPDARKSLSVLLKQASGGGGFDVIFDAVGGDYSEPALRAVAWGGRYLVVGFAAGEIPRIPLNLTLLKGIDICGVWWGAWIERYPELHRQNVDELLAFYRQGRIKPHISALYPLEKGGEAIALLAERKALGKVVVIVG